MRDGGSDGGEAEPISECKECAKVNFPELVVCFHVKLKLIVDNGSNIVLCSIGHEQVRGEDGERLGVVEIEPPVRCGHDHIEEQHIAKKDVDGGEEG